MTPARAEFRIGNRTGIGLRAPHYRDFLDMKPDVGFVEVHSENFFVDGGQPLAVLERVRSRYALSFHGVGLSLGSAEPPSREHLVKLKRLVDRFEPALVSEHLSWNALDGHCLNDLVPLPYNEEALAWIARNVAETQDFLGRRILIENPSTYLAFRDSTMPEWDFLALLAEATGCGILLDVNNIFVSVQNNSYDPYLYLSSIPGECVAEIHLAGHDSQGELLIDSHAKPVAGSVWDLYAHAVTELGDVPTLIEWDADLPELHDLLAEARKADAIRTAAQAAEVPYALAS